MTLTIDLPPADERRLQQRAERAGRPVAELAADLLRDALDHPPRLFEIAAPFAAEFAASGMTEAEFDALIEEAREEVWQDQKAKGTA